MTATDDGQRLLNQIRETPGDDTLRLAYADWLDEQPVERVKCRKCNGTKDDVIRDYFRFGTRFTEGVAQGCQVCSGLGTVRDERRQRRAELIRRQIRGETLRPGELLDAHGAEWARVECPTCRNWPDMTIGFCPDCTNQRDTTHGRNPQWSRGFVSQVECRLEEVGSTVPRTCPECQGRPLRRASAGKGFIRCGHCVEGTGRVFRPSPWIAAVFRQHPIEGVRITDREPMVVGATLIMHEWGRATWAASLAGERDYIPDAIFAKMRGFTGTSASHNSLHVRYPTTDAARDALARAVADVVRDAMKGGA